MDDELAEALIDRDWPSFIEQVQRLGLGTPVRAGTRIDLTVRPPQAADDFRAVLLCDGYDAQAPLLDFADPEHPDQLGSAYWPRIDNAPMNSVIVDGRQIPIICTPGTRGYHLHQSHVAEQHPQNTWRLARVGTLIGHFLRMGPYRGRGV